MNLSSLVNFTNHVYTQKFSFHSMVMFPGIKSCNKDNIFTISWNGNLYKNLSFLNVFRKKSSVKEPCYSLPMGVSDMQQS